MNLSNTQNSGLRIIDETRKGIFYRCSLFFRSNLWITSTIDSTTKTLYNALVRYQAQNLRAYIGYSIIYGS